MAKRINMLGDAAPTESKKKVNKKVNGALPDHDLPDMVMPAQELAQLQKTNDPIPANDDNEFAGMFAMGKEKSDMLQIVEEFTNPKNIEAKSEINDAQISLFTTIKVFHRSYPELGLDQLPEIFMHLTVSKRGKGRKELLDAIKGNFASNPLETRDSRFRPPGT